MMQKALNGNVTLDIDSMSLEELKEARDNLRESIAKDDVAEECLPSLRQLLFNLNHQITMRMLYSHKHPTSHK